MKAIETHYKGHRFRSRLEARWAVFFTAAGLPWEYEPEGFEREVNGSTVRWLPDFHLPTLGRYVEVKPRGLALFNEDDYVNHLVTTAYLYDDIPMAALVGDPWPNEYGLYLFDAVPGSSPPEPLSSVTVFAQCRRCEAFCLCYLDEGAGDDFFYAYTGTLWGEPTGWGDFGRHTCGDHDRQPLLGGDKIMKAYASARGARFEHGEAPQ